MNKLYVVGIGPGAYEKMTIEAAEALKKSDVIIGYTVYVDLVREHFPEKEFMTTPMNCGKKWFIKTNLNSSLKVTVSLT